MAAHNDIQAPDVMRAVVGFSTYAEVTAITRLIEGSKIEIVEAAQTAQKFFNACAPEELGGQDPDIAFINPGMQGYSHELVNDLLLREEGPIPAIGYVAVEDVSAYATGMMNAGAKWFFSVAKPPSTADLLMRSDRAYIEVMTDWKEGRLRPKVPEVIARAGSVHQQVLTFWVPKGGGSTRTTIAVNLASALAMTGNTVVLVDFDQTKGDVHIHLGFTPDNALPVARDMVLVDRGLYDLMVNLAARWPKMGKGAVEPTTLRNYIIEWRREGVKLHLLPGLTAAHQAGSDAFADPQIVHEAALTILDVLKSMYTFVLVDIGQDYNMPLHAAAIQTATEVLVPIPPTVTAAVDVARGMPALKSFFGSLEKFRWVPTAWREGPTRPTLKQVTDTVRLPRLDVIIPHDVEVADESVNGGVPFSLVDQGPLGEAMRSLARLYDPSVPKLGGGKGGLFGGLRGLFVREA